MNEHELSLSERLLAALIKNTQAQARLVKAITTQADAIAALADTITSQSDDDDEGETGSTYLSGAAR